MKLAVALRYCEDARGVGMNKAKFVERLSRREGHGTFPRAVILLEDYFWDLVARAASCAPVPTSTSLSSAAVTKAFASDCSMKRSRTSSLPATLTAVTNPS